MRKHRVSVGINGFIGPPEICEDGHGDGVVRDLPGAEAGNVGGVIVAVGGDFTCVWIMVEAGEEFGL